MGQGEGLGEEDEGRVRRDAKGNDKRGGKGRKGEWRKARKR
jgi:hypothetical protein